VKHLFPQFSKLSQKLKTNETTKFYLQYYWSESRHSAGIDCHNDSNTIVDYSRFIANTICLLVTTFVTKADIFQGLLNV